MKQNSPRMITFDMDGTVLYDGAEISDRLASILKRALERGIYVVPCSGRGRRQLPKTLEQLGVSFTITSNGSRIIDERTGQSIYENLVPYEMAAKIYEDAAVWSPLQCVHIEGHVYFQSDDEQFLRKKFFIPDYMPVDLTHSTIEEINTRKKGVEKIYFRPDTEADRNALREKLLATYPIFTSSSSFHNLEVGVIGCNKGTALRWLCQHLGIDPSEVISFGDGENDKEMLTYAGLGAAMSGGHTACKAAADLVIGSCEEDGVAEFLEQYLL